MPSLKTKIMLSGRAAIRCSFPECRRELVFDATETDDASLVGENCHIVAKSKNGPRGNSALTEKERKKYDNLIFMCGVHHKLIDDQPNTYTVDVLLQMKKNHEDWVKSNLEYDFQKQEDDEKYASYIEEWASRVRLNEWREWSSLVLSSDQPKLSCDFDDVIEKTRFWLLSRKWPGRYLELETAFQNFRCIMSDFQETFRRHAEVQGNVKVTNKFYQINQWDKEQYENLAEEYDQHVDLTQDLLLELTRAANYICDCVRQTIDPTFRMEEGVLMVQTATILHSQIRRLEYSEEDRQSGLYKGLDKFDREDRFKRDFCFGTPHDPASNSRADS